MKSNRMAFLTIVAVLLFVSSSSHLEAQSVASGTSSAYATDANKLSDKFVGLARVMSGKYDWRPGTDVRSVGEVLNLIVAENGTLTGMLTGATAPAGSRPSVITDPAKMQEALKDSYAHLQTAIGSLTDSDLRATVKMFGKDMTKQAALILLMSDQHEHLGQSIAYARVNGIVPPWSK